MFRSPLACGSEQGGGCSERLAGHTAHSKKKKTKKKVMPRVECTSGVVHHGFGSTVLCCAHFDSTWVGVRQGGVHKADSGDGHAAENSGTGEVRGWRQWSSAILGTFVKMGDTGQGKSKEWSKGAATGTHVLHMVESLF